MRPVLARGCALLFAVLLAAACGGGGGGGAGGGGGGGGGGATFVPNFRPGSIQAVPPAAVVNRASIALCCLGPKVTVLYYDISTTSIYARRSLDAGATWRTPDILVGVSPGVGRLSVASHGDRVHVAWSEGYTVTYPTGRVLVASSADLGETWTVPVRIDPPAFGGPLGEVAVACSATNACLAWNQYPPSATGAADEIPIQVWTIASLDGGASFAATTIQQHGVSGRAQVLSEGVWCEGSSVALAFRDEPLTGADRDVAVRCVLSTDGGVTWGSATRVDSLGAGTGDNAAAKNAYVTGSGGHVAVLWGIDNGGPEAGMRTNHTLDGGATWGTDLLVVPADQALEGIRRLRGLGGRVFVGHRTPSPPIANGVVASSVGGAWADSAPLNRLPPGGTVSASPMIGTSQGTLFAVWVDLEGSTYTVRGAWSTDGGIAWSPDTPFHVAGGAVTLADACVDLPYAYLLLQAANSFWLVASAP